MLKHRNHQSAAGRHSVYRERKHYTGQIVITISMKRFFSLEIKHLGETTEAIQIAPFWCSPPHCRVSKKQLFAFTYLPAPAIYNFHITAVTNERQYIKQNLSAPENSARPFSERVLKPAAYCQYSMLVNKALSHTTRGKCFFFGLILPVNMMRTEPSRPACSPLW